MKKLVQVQEVEGQGLEALLGQQVTFFCMNYIYHGKLIGVNTTDILIENGHIVYVTGAFTQTAFSDAQLVSKELRIRTAAIESYCVTKAVAV